MYIYIYSVGVCAYIYIYVCMYMYIFACVCMYMYVCVCVCLVCRSLQSVQCENQSLRACKVAHVHSVAVSVFVSVSGGKRGEVSNHVISNRTAIRVLYRHYCRLQVS